MSNRTCPDYSWGYNHCPGPDREPGHGDDSCCWKCSQVKELEALRSQIGQMRPVIEAVVRRHKIWLNEEEGDLWQADAAAKIAVSRYIGIQETVAIRQQTEKRKDQDREVCWFAEVNRESKAACFACKDQKWPRWVAKGYGKLTDDPNEAARWPSREGCLKFSCLGTVSHWHLHPTEHVFVSR